MNANVSAVKTDNVTNLANNGEVLETLGVNDNLSPVVISDFTALMVEGGIDNLE